MVTIFITEALALDEEPAKRVKERIEAAAEAGPTLVAIDERAYAGASEGDAAFIASAVASLGLAEATPFSLEGLAVRKADGSVDASLAAERRAEFRPPRLGLAFAPLDELAAFSAALGSALVVLTASGPITQCDAAIVSDAMEIAALSFEEAAELSRFDGTGLDAEVAGPLSRYRAEALVVSARPGPGGRAVAGTRIEARPAPAGGPVKAIARQEGVAMLSVSGTCLPGKVGIAARLFAAVGRAGVSVLTISQSSSEYSICFCVSSADESRARAAVEGEFSSELAARELEPISVIGDLSILTLVGDGMRSIKGIAGKCFTQLGRADINVYTIAQGASERSLSTVVAKERVDRGIRMVYQAFFDTTMPIDIVLVGCGNVGSALLRQLASQAERLEGHDVSARVVAITNSTRMIVDQRGIDPVSWKARFEAEGRPADLGALKALGQELTNPVIVDCTAGEALPKAYAEFMVAGFHVVTPNKRGNTGPYKRYLAIKQLARRHRRRYLYETTVGAGLPVIENLQNLLHAGDRLDSFSGILSGSLSFLFGRLEEGLPFSSVVREAMARGFTEPDPRDDLSGMDVARKVLILAREAGLPLELGDIELEGLVPPEYAGLDKAEFASRLEELDGRFSDMCASAAAAGKVLRFVGSIEGGKGRVGLQAVGPDHPLYAVKGGENALAFSTRYYSPVPLLLRGYGAGAEVTAAGIFADILRTLNWIREA